MSDNQEKWTGWETEAEWALEQRAFNWSSSWGEESTRELINHLWSNYCLMYDHLTMKPTTVGQADDLPPKPT